MTSGVPLISHEYSCHYDVVPVFVAVPEVFLVLIVVLSSLDRRIDCCHHTSDENPIVLHKNPEERGQVAEPKPSCVYCCGS